MKHKSTFTLLILITLITNHYADAQTSSIATTTLSNCQTQIVTLSCKGGIASHSVSSNQIVVFNSAMIPSLTSVNINYATYNGIANSILCNPNLPSYFPITITGVTNIYISPVSTAFSTTFTVLTPSTNSVSITPINSVVIPSDATGNVQIILESSSDLVNWIPSQAGTYGSTYSNRFFRVRALAQ